METTNIASHEQVLQHHLEQNMGQKLTAHLILGLTHAIAANIRKNDELRSGAPSNEAVQDTGAK